MNRKQEECLKKLKPMERIEFRLRMKELDDIQPEFGVFIFKIMPFIGILFMFTGFVAMIIHNDTTVFLQMFLNFFWVVAWVVIVDFVIFISTLILHSIKTQKLWEEYFKVERK